MIQAVIFDMDGLLVDSEPVWDSARKWMADGAGKPWDALDHDAVIGRMVAMYEAGVPYFPGAVELVDLAAASYRTALASGSHPTLIDTVTADPPMRGKFEIIVAADEVGAGKPAPDVYLAAAQRLGVDPQDSVCLEDSGNGILSGAAAGMKVIAVPDPRFPPSQEKLDRADVVVTSLSEVTPELIARLG